MCWLLNWLLRNNVKMTEVVFVSQSVQPNGGDRHELSRSVYEHVRINWDKCSKEKEYGPWELVTKESDTWRRWLLTVSRREGIKRRDQVEEPLRQRERYWSKRECGVSKEWKRTCVAGVQDVRGWSGVCWGRRHGPESPCRELRAVEGFKVGVRDQVCSGRDQGG